MIKYKIGAIFENDAETPKVEYQYRVDRTGYITFLEENKPLLFTYEDGHGTLTTSNVKTIDETDYGVWISTQNTVFRLDIV